MPTAHSTYASVLKTLAAFSAICLVTIALTGIASAQDERSSSFVLRLSDANFQTLTSSGSLNAAIADSARGQLSSIVVGAASNSADPESLDGAVEINNDTATIEIGDAMLDQLKQGAVRYNLDDGEFGRVVLKFTGTSNTAEMSDATEMAPKVDNGSGMKPEPMTEMPEINAERIYYIDLGNNEMMEGTVDGLNDFEVDTKFGKVTVPMDHIAGIRFHTGSDDSAVVILNNGDSITGAPTVKAVELQTQWGQADIEPEAMQSIVTDRNATFSQESSLDFGTRWVLRKAIPVGSPQFGSPQLSFPNGQFGG